MPVILGIDSSLTGTGLVRYTDQYPVPTFPDTEPDVFIGQLAAATVRAPKAKTGDKSHLTTSRRISHVIRGIEAAIIEMRPDVIGLEDFPVGLKGEAIKVYWLWGRVVDLAVGYGIPLVTVHNTAVKAFATGNGNADKDEVMLAMANRYPTFPVRNNNEADALAVAMITARHIGHPIDTAPQAYLDKTFSKNKVATQ